MSAFLKRGIDKYGNLLSIEEVATGKNCNCYCPECKNPLIAKNSIPKEFAKKEHHFAHQKGCLCEASDETLLHSIAKDIIFEDKAIMLPVSESQRIPSGLVHFRSVEMEKWNDEYGCRPDLEATLENGEKMWIEFYVSHKVPHKKRSIIIKNRINCIEIDLNYVEIDKAKIRSFLMNMTDNREWIRPFESKGKSKIDNDDNNPYPSNPLHNKAIHYIKEVFDKGELIINWNGKFFNLRNLYYDVCEPTNDYRKFKTDLLLYRSQKRDKGIIAVSIRGRRRNFNHKTPRDLRVIDIIVRSDMDYNRLIERKYLFDNQDSIIFEGFKRQKEDRI